MKFEIDFNDSNISNDKFFIDILQARYEPTGATKYGPFEKLVIDLDNFEQLEWVLKKVDKEFNCISSAVVSYDPATIYIDLLFIN
jgi:hypothetical protein